MSRSGVRPRTASGPAVPGAANGQRADMSGRAGCDGDTALPCDLVTQLGTGIAHARARPVRRVSSWGRQRLDYVREEAVPALANGECTKRQAT